MTLWMPVVSGLAAGAASAPHCLAMCGPLAIYASRRDDSAAMARYQVGRLLAYASLGSLAGWSGRVVANSLASQSWVQLLLSAFLAGGMLIMALRLVRPTLPSGLIRLGRGPKLSLASKLFQWLPHDPVWLGAISALLPCGALYSALLIASSAGSASGGAASMSAFAMSSGLGLISAGWVARLQTSKSGRIAIASLLVFGSIAVIARPTYAAITGDPTACHNPDAL